MQPVVETSKTHTRSSDDNKSLNVEMAHDQMEQPFVETNIKKCQLVAKHVLVMKAQASTLETKQFAIERGNPL